MTWSILSTERRGGRRGKGREEEERGEKKPEGEGRGEDNEMLTEKAARVKTLERISVPGSIKRHKLVLLAVDKHVSHLRASTPMRVHQQTFVCLFLKATLLTLSSMTICHLNYSCKPSQFKTIYTIVL